ncbi:MAG: hypothetical protein WAX89_01430 [Alphaproteobacteria bacterium]
MNTTEHTERLIGLIGQVYQAFPDDDKLASSNEPADHLLLRSKVTLRHVAKNALQRAGINDYEPLIMAQLGIAEPNYTFLEDVVSDTIDGKDILTLEEALRDAGNKPQEALYDYVSKAGLELPTLQRD